MLYVYGPRSRVFICSVVTCVILTENLRKQKTENYLNLNLTEQVDKDLTSFEIMGLRELSKSKKNKKPKHRKIVSFDEEIITKDSALKYVAESAPIVENKETDDIAQILENSERKVKKNKNPNIENNSGAKEHSKHKRKSVTAVFEKSNDVEKDSSTEVQSKKRKKNEKRTQSINAEINEEVSVEKPEIKKADSIRAQKRAKHAKLLEEKKLKAVIDSQQNVLNYLSKWKHSREEWKFQKLKQIWLQQNLFDCSKIPDEFWETAVDYFSSSKGFIRNCVLRDALKIIEKEESSEEENTDKNHLLVLKRARDIVQNLQE